MDSGDLETIADLFPDEETRDRLMQLMAATDIPSLAVSLLTDAG